MNANKLFLSPCFLVSYNEKCEGCESKNHYFAGCARAHARETLISHSLMQMKKLVGATVVIVPYVAKNHESFSWLN